MDRETQPQTLMAVDVYDAPGCTCHTIILARQMDTHHAVRAWLLYFTKKTRLVSFGDYLEYAPDKGELHIVRTDKLKFRIHLELMPAAFAARLIEELPYIDMYGREVNYGVPDEPEGD